MSSRASSHDFRNLTIKEEMSPVTRSMASVGRGGQQSASSSGSSRKGASQQGSLPSGSSGQNSIIRNDVNELLSVFEPSGRLPKEYERVDVSTEQDPIGKLYRQFGDTMIKQCIEDPDILESLRATVTDERAGEIGVKKIRDRFIKVFRELDKHIESGPTSGSAMDVINAATELRNIADAADEFIIFTPRRSNKLRKELFATLLQMLLEVLLHAGNKYETVTWTQPDYVPGPRDRDLFIRLIGKEAPPENEKDFVLPVLETIGREMAQGPDIRVLVTNILTRLTALGAHAAYVASFSRLTNPNPA